MLGDFDVVVEEPDQPQPGHQEQDEKPAHREARAAQINPPQGGQCSEQQMSTEISDQRGRDDDCAAHGRRATFGVVGRGSVVPNELAIAATDQKLDEERRSEHRDHH